MILRHQPRRRRRLALLVLAASSASSSLAFTAEHARRVGGTVGRSDASARQQLRPLLRQHAFAGRRYSAAAASASSLRMSSIGGGSEDNNGGGGDGSDNPLNEWIQRRGSESDNVKMLREQFAEGRLPISYGAMSEDGSEESKARKNGKKKNGKFGPLNDDGDDSSTDDAIDATASSSSSGGLARNKPNPYLSVVSRLTPSDLIARFTSTASPRVQDAVRTTVLGLIGGLPSMAFETKTIATGERLASLMFQLQMTGYMFKNAEYRLSLSQSLGRSDIRMLPGDQELDASRAVREGRGKLKGKIKVRYGGGGGSAAEEEGKVESKDDSPEEAGSDDEATKAAASEKTSPSTFSAAPGGMEVEVDAQAYMSELRGEVSRLRDELEATKQAKEEEIRKDLLMYIRTLPQQELQQLTGTMSPEVLEAMKGLVTAVLAGIGEDDDGNEGGLESIMGGGEQEGNANKIGPDTVTEQSGEALAQLCMWQLVVGFNLRELEVREEFRASMTNMLGDGGVRGGENDAGFGPGALE